MFSIGVRKYFSAAHYLRGYKGKCEELHGHNWQVETCVSGDTLDELGMVMDFKELKKKINAVLGELDHRLINDHPHFSEHNPSSEELARYIHTRLSEGLEKGLCVDHVTVWESERCWARYAPTKAPRPEGT